MSKRLIPDPQVQERYSISAMTLWRWDHDANLGFPKPLYIRGRKYRDAAELDAFDEAHRKEARTNGTYQGAAAEVVEKVVKPLPSTPLTQKSNQPRRLHRDWRRPELPKTMRGAR